MNAPTIAVFGSSRTQPDTSDWNRAERVGSALALAGFNVATGGYGGTMEAVSKGARREGGHVIGVTAPGLFPGRSGANRYVADERPAPSLHTRIEELVEGSAGCIALPGSIGTVTELLVAWNVNDIRRRGGAKTIPVAAVGEGWFPLRDLLAGLGADPDDIDWFSDADAAVEWIVARAFHMSGDSRDLG